MSEKPGPGLRDLPPDQEANVRAYLIWYVDKVHDGDKSAAAKAIGVSQPTVSNVYRGEARAGHHMVKQLCGATKDPPWRIKGEPPPTGADLSIPVAARELVAQLDAAVESGDPGVPVDALARFKVRLNHDYSKLDDDALFAMWEDVKKDTRDAAGRLGLTGTPPPGGGKPDPNSIKPRKR